ncbi:MAG: hypothetical protein KBF93_20655, partial [Leptospiraceae bacterium]|nr:hypothetical protein [Leptospiraceae bacterium]
MFFRILVFLCFIVLVSIYSCSKQNKPQQPKAVEGILDIRDWDFDSNGKLDLYGQWEFYYGEFLTAENFTKAKGEKPKFIEVPSLWNGYDWNGTKLPGSGFATYRLLVKSKNLNKIMGLRIGDMYSSYKSAPYTHL